MRNTYRESLLSDVGQTSAMWWTAHPASYTCAIVTTTRRHTLLTQKEPKQWTRSTKPASAKRFWGPRSVCSVSTRTITCWPTALSMPAQWETLVSNRLTSSERQTSKTPCKLSPRVKSPGFCLSGRPAGRKWLHQRGHQLAESTRTGSSRTCVSDPLWGLCWTLKSCPTKGYRVSYL